MNRLSKSSVALISFQNIAAFISGVLVNKVSDQVRLSWALTIICTISVILLSIVLGVIASLKAQESPSVVQPVEEQARSKASKGRETFLSTKYYALSTFVFGDFAICGFLIYGLVDKVKLPFYPLYWYLGAFACAVTVWCGINTYSSFYKRHVNNLVKFGMPVILFCILSIIGFQLL